MHRRGPVLAVVAVVVLLSGGMPLLGQSAASNSPPALTNTDVTRLVALGVSDLPIAAVIKETRERQFDFSTAGLAALRAARVSETVIGVMQQYVPTPTVPPAAAAVPPASGYDPASSLIGLTQDKVRAKIGSPSLA